MPVEDLGKLGMRMRAARNEMGLTQQRLSDMCHVSIREIAKIENEEMNPSFLILKAIIQILHNSLDSLIISDGSADEGAEQMKMLYLSCSPEMQETLLSAVSAGVAVSAVILYHLGIIFGFFLPYKPVKKSFGICG